MASNDLNITLAPRSEARGQSLHSAARPENSGADRSQQGRSSTQGAEAAPRAAVRGAFSDAMLRSRSGDSRVRHDPQAAGAARRALPMHDDSEDADLNIIPLVPAVEVEVVHRADPRLEQSGRQDFLVNILRSELQAAFALMEHRERWWTEGLHNAESFVGMEMDRVRASEHNAAQEMNSQMTSLVETLRATQSRAEQSSLAVLVQQTIISNDLELYANKLTAQGRAMINKSEQKHWSIVTELAKVRSDLARVETEAERKIRVTLLECESHAHGLELSARAADVRSCLV